MCRGVTGYLKKLREFLGSPAGRKAEDEDVKIKKMALRSTENIQVRGRREVVGRVGVKWWRWGRR